MILTPLYHWAPANRFEEIRRTGMKIYRSPTVAGSALPYICASPDPQTAWKYSGAMDWVNEISTWDLWLLHLAMTDECWVRPDYGPLVIEIKIKSEIPPDRLWWVGRRQDLGVPDPAPAPLS